MFRRSALAGLGAALALTLTACSDSTTAPGAADPQLSADIAVVAADGAAEDVMVMRDPMFELPSFFAGPEAVFAAAAAAGRPGNFNMSNCTLAAGVFTCPSFTREGLTITRTYQFFAGDVVQDKYDSLTTSKAKIHTTIKGTRSGDSWSATVDKIRDMTVSGLTGAETQRTWNGTGAGTANRSRHSDGGEARTYNVSETTAVTNVVVPFPRTENGWPISGSITRNVTCTYVGGKNDGKTTTRTVTITFNGTQLANMTVTGGGETKTYQFDLKTRKRVTP